MEEFPNLSHIKEIAGDDADFVKRYISLMQEEFSWEAGMYLRHIKKSEPREAAEMVGKSKYKLSMLGLEQAYAFAIKYEQALQQGDSSRDVKYRKILDHVNNFLIAVQKND